VVVSEWCFVNSESSKTNNHLSLINNPFAFVPLHLSRALYKSTLFMQNKPNFWKSQMNVNKVLTRDYEKRTLGERGKNKPNTKPIQTQFKPNSNPISQRAKLMQSVCLQRIMKNNADMGYEKTNPIKPNFKRDTLLLCGALLRTCPEPGSLP